MVSAQHLALGLLAISVLVGCSTWVYTGMRSSGVRWWLGGYALWSAAYPLLPVASTAQVSWFLGPLLVTGAWCHFVGSRKVLGAAPTLWWAAVFVPGLSTLLGWLLAEGWTAWAGAAFSLCCLALLVIVVRDLIERRRQISPGQRWSVVVGWSALLLLCSLGTGSHLALGLWPDRFNETLGSSGTLEAALSLFVLALCQNLLVIGLLSEAKARALAVSEDQQVQLSRANRELNEFQTQILTTLTDLLESRLDESAAHVRRVGGMVQDVFRALGYEEDYCRTVADASMLHDIGKVGVPDEILRKPGALTPEERRIMETHAILGARLLAESEVPFFRIAATVAAEHHELWDGRGYPVGKRGEEISLEARVVAVADCYEALTRTRIYKEAWTQEAAEAYLRDHAGTRFDPALVEVFLQLPASSRSPAGSG